MYIAKISGHIVGPGIEIEIAGVDDFKFKVVEVRKSHFIVEWLLGDNAGSKDAVPFSIFKDVGQPVEVTEITDDENNPNRAFLHKKLSGG